MIRTLVLLLLHSQWANQTTLHGCVPRLCAVVGFLLPVPQPQRILLINHRKGFSMIEDQAAEAAIATINKVVGSLEQTKKILDMFHDEHQQLVQQVLVMDAKMEAMYKDYSVMSKQIVSLIGEKNS